VSPLDDGRLWGYVEAGQLADLSPLVTNQAGRVFWVPGAERGAGRPSGTRVVVTERTSGDDFWLPAGVYADHWTLREGTPVQTASQLLALPGVVDLASGRGQHLLGASPR
jgi:hypothetical protein